MYIYNNIYTYRPYQKRIQRQIRIHVRIDIHTCTYTDTYIHMCVDTQAGMYVFMYPCSKLSLGVFGYPELDLVPEARRTMMGIKKPYSNTCMFGGLGFRGLAFRV